MEYFAKTINDIYPLTILAKSLDLDVYCVLNEYLEKIYRFKTPTMKQTQKPPKDKVKQQTFK